MVEYAVSDLVKEVKVLLDRNQESAGLLAPSDSDTLSQAELIESKIVDAARIILSDAPEDMVEEKYGEEAVNDAIDQCFQTMRNVVTGKFTEEMITAFIKAKNHDTDVADAAHEGEVRGKNSIFYHYSSPSSSTPFSLAIAKMSSLVFILERLTP
jgi:hypothetical protein